MKRRNGQRESEFFYPFMCVADFEWALSNYRGKITPRETEVVALRLSGRTYAECALVIGISIERARQLWMQAGRKLEAYAFWSENPLGSANPARIAARDLYEAKVSPGYLMVVVDKLLEGGVGR